MGSLDGLGWAGWSKAPILLSGVVQCSAVQCNAPSADAIIIMAGAVTGRQGKPWPRAQARRPARPAVAMPREME